MITAILLSTALTVDPELVVTAAREPLSIDTSPVVVDVVSKRDIEALGYQQLVDVLRLAPGVSISRSGGTGSQTQVRLRGAEANHTLVFIDGIESNDPASSGEFRWETLAADGIERVELLQGPQSALWGSEAIGGVVAVTTRYPGNGRSAFAAAEAGSFGTRHAAGGIAIGGEAAGVVVQSSWYDTAGIDSFAPAPHERDGFENATVSLKAVVRPSPRGELGLVVRHATSLSEFDGFDPVSFRHADTLDATRIRSTALRAYARLNGPWRHELFGTTLTTDNVNRDGSGLLNRTDARTFRTGYQTGFDFTAGGASHRLTGAAEYREQLFTAHDDAFFGGTNQRQTRERLSLVADYALSAGSLLLSVSLRHDDNDSFGDATTWRTAARYTFGGGWSVRASAGRGVTDPTFTEQFGFFPGSFIGNPDLTPEKSVGWDTGIGYSQDGIALDVGYFDADLTDEILSTFDPATFLSSVANANGKSRRRGVEVRASARPLRWLDLRAHYTYLDASEGKIAGNAHVREVRRARHTAGASATATFESGSIAFLANYVGKRRDTDFDSFPAQKVTLEDYVLASISGEYRLRDGIALTGRIENAFNARYEDVFGSATPGLSAYAGVRVRWGG